MNASILIIINSLTIGGAERQVVADANMLVRNGYDVTIAFFRDGPLNNKLSDEVKTYQINHKNAISAMLQLVRFLKFNRFDIIFGHMFWAHKIVAIPAFIMRYRYVFFEHGLGLQRKWYHLFCIRFLDKLASKVVTVSEAKKRIKIEREKIVLNKLIVIPNCYSPINIEMERKLCKYNRGKCFQLISIIYVGRFSKVKQIQVLVDIAHLLIDKNINFRFILCGNGTEFEYIKTRIREQHLDSFFYLPGNVLNPYQFLNTADIFVLPSRVEDLSVSLLEAGFACLPAIAFDVGGNSEIIIDGKTGFIVRPYDKAHFADRIIYLANNKSIREKMGKNAHEWIVYNFSEARRRDRLIELINLTGQC